MNTQQIHLARSRRQRPMLVAAIALASITGACVMATGALAGAQRVAVSATDATAQPPAAFVAVSPLRVLDTRPAPFGPIGVPSSAPIPANTTLNLQLAGDGLAIPANATSALLNVTVDQDATLKSFLTIWPTGEARPNTSANNAEPGLIVANSMIAKIGTNGSISIYNQQGSVDIVIDLVGYTVPLSTVAGATGGQLLSGAGAPANTVGNDGDFYVDTTTGTLYGPKTGGVWNTPAIALGGAQGAASAYNAAPATILAPSTTPAPITFDTAGPADGSITRTDTSTFTVAAAGLYRVDYHIDLSVAALGTIRVAVDGVGTGPSSNLTVLVTEVANSVLVSAAPGDTIQLVFTPTIGGVSLTLAQSSIVVEQSTSA